jgi:hypothetical protein
MRNAQDSENCSTNGYICNNKVRSVDIKGEGSGQEAIAMYRTRDHQAKGSMCPSDVRHSKASDVVQEELMSLLSLAAKNEHSSNCEMPEGHFPSRTPLPKGLLGY